MSLHTLANHLQSAGRGQDKVLVHMTPGEVQGLQSLAMAHGGSLTINPETGLPEAGILSAILPMVAGFFLGPAGLQLTAMQSALTVGALGTAATGSLGKGFMMGLGAYGGAGLGEGLMTAGAPPNITPSVTDPTLGGFSQNPALTKVGTTTDLGTIGGTDTFANLTTKAPVTPTGGFNSLQGFNSQSIMAPNAVQNVPSWYSASPVPTTTVPIQSASEVFSKGLVNPPVEVSQVMPGPTVNVGDVGSLAKPSNVVDLSKQGISDLASTTKSNLLPEARMSLPGGRETLVGGEMSTIPKQTSPFVETPTASAPSNWDQVGSGFKKATGSWEGLKDVWKATPTGTGYGLAATGMGVMQAQQEEAAKEAKAKADAMAAARRGYYRPYDFTTNLADNAFAPRESSAEFKYYEEPRFVARPIEKIAKEGGLMSLAVGGQVEEMSARNAIGGNMMYPQSQLQTDMYANPMVQRPMQTNVISSGLDVPVDRYTGEQKMAIGGAAAAKAEPTTDTKYSYDPATMKYTQTTTETPAANATNPFFGKIGIPGFGYIPHVGIGNGTGGGIAPMGGSGVNGFVNPQLLAAIFGGQQAAPQPTTTTETMGGTIAPYTPPSGLAAADTSMMPNMQMQPQQNIDKQLGLEAFYPMMEQQLALKGSNLQARGYANGGVARFGGGGTMAQPTAEGTARQKYARENKAGIIPSVSDEEWNNYKKLQNLSFTSAASSAPTYKYNPATMQYTDNAGKVSGGMEQSFIPVIMPQQLTSEEQMGLGGYQGYAEGGTANGGYSLGSYSDGGRLLRGLGDGVSDSIPAQIGDYQPARLANNEFVIPARIVSEIGNGSTDAGAKRLYEMMDRVQKRRGKTVGKGKVAVDSGAHKELARL